MRSNTCRWRWAALLALIPTLTLVAWGQESPARRRAATIGPQWSALMGTMETMHAAINSVGPSGDSDVDFVSLMLTHHRAALDMARTELLYGKDPQMRQLAQEIVYRPAIRDRVDATVAETPGALG